MKHIAKAMKIDTRNNNTLASLVQLRLHKLGYRLLSVEREILEPNESQPRYFFTSELGRITFSLSDYKFNKSKKKEVKPIELYITDHDAFKPPPPNVATLELNANNDSLPTVTIVRAINESQARQIATIMDENINTII